MNCPQCHRALIGNARWCGRCGMSIRSEPAPAPTRHPEPARVSLPAGGRASEPKSYATSLSMRIRGLMLRPGSEWRVIRWENTGVGALYARYVLPLAAFAALLHFAHVSVIGAGLLPAGSRRAPLGEGVSSALLYFFVGLVGLSAVGLVINGLAPVFGGTRDRHQALKLAAYSFTPGWLGAVLSLSPILSALLQFGAACYGVYLLNLGLPLLMGVPRRSAAGYTATVTNCCVVLGVLLALALQPDLLPAHLAQLCRQIFTRA